MQINGVGWSMRFHEESIRRRVIFQSAQLLIDSDGEFFSRVNMPAIILCWSGVIKMHRLPLKWRQLLCFGVPKLTCLPVFGWGLRAE
ncbi:hypothetical protein PVT68_07355 [Microbulbifer bruguierae]|uniref:Uncharacterized protein n=1 Tax=Microbulbifer bruguierae TaxID=3029061 RepID=A0ABY8NH17_9GAMM|nr:hypothetical protein [Microbulbifer bruguierae]WGL18103.1 hypothetical protein PVT68_07355 [Microbulbifer bruguierae]